MREMIERVATALKAQDNNMAVSFHHYEALARAAIAAMREPTEEMLKARCARGKPHLLLDDWQAMIDAALEGK